MRTLLLSSILVALFALGAISTVTAACGGCQSGADDWEAACYRSTRDAYRLSSAAYCCRNYLLNGGTCIKNGCGGCSGNSARYRACADRVVTTSSESYSYSRSCGWWRRCTSTGYRTKTSTRTKYHCCSGYSLRGSYCVKSTTTQPTGACGISKYSNAANAASSIAPAIVRGTTARPNEFPWQVSLRYISSKRLLCGGTIIGSRHILTAAHCIRAVSSFSVYVGDHRISLTEPTQRIHSVASSTVHQSYNTSTYANDVAIIRLTKPISFNADVKPACLPTSSSKSYVNRDVIISGWGKTSTNGPSADPLQYASVRVTSASYCKQYYMSYLIGASVLCVTDATGDRDKSSCKGDSGGPMVVKEPDGKWYVVGVASFGSRKKGCAGGRPFGYQNVAYHLDWIKSKMN